MKRIGQGTYGSVYLAKRKDGIGGYVVMKRVFVFEENSKQHKQAQNEVKVLQVSYVSQSAFVDLPDDNDPTADVEASEHCWLQGFVHT